ncbi:chromatin remodelling complex ATPase chain [Moesziomyces antarcticus]|uniref:Chromatin remodelling complex ATPase chain n=2 Tax=Pseudozyma antarctica TaxID=84753 RepID=A0A081CCT9_PSEA2|nr:chromatin remodelling complex ATPase chain [Moesziomyces antarcticus]GAK64485.1 chromatin remodelling complex ATPase chain [Moesziomyces antarcticus]SPO45006.1 probable ISW2 - ATPase component of a two subunit chromatin remodeling complex [Moesziomyces antarcticus]
MSHTPNGTNGSNGHLKPSALPPAMRDAKNWEDQDKLSDYIPVSADLSRAPTASASVSRAQTPPNKRDNDTDASDDDADQLEDDGDVSMSSPSKTARQLEKQREKEERAAARKHGKAVKAAQDETLASTRESMAKAKLADSFKRYGYLLDQTELFQHFIDIKKERDQEFAAMLEESQQAAAKKAKKAGDNRRRKTEKEEDDELLKEGDDDQDEGAFVFNESPAYVKGGTMRDYQVQGLNWMISLYHNGINGILADEMGLGKTLQTISFLGYLRDFRNTPGFHLVVVPKSTLDNWYREFQRWVPGFNVVTLKGSKEERDDVIQKHLLPQDFDVLITTYEMCLREKSALKKLSWEYIIIDEAHRIKNVDSMLSQIVRAFNSRSRLLITGTPLQNNLMELWSLLNFLLPDVFSNSEDFESWFKGKGDENQDQVVQQLHKVLRPFLLRRVKADVEKSLLPKKEINLFVGLTEMQRKWYKSILEKDIDAVNGGVGKKEGKTRLLNIVMQLRKCCNHPYLFDGAEPGPPFTTDEHLVFNSDKMKKLDKLLRKMKANGSRVLIFSQMSRMLDILEDYCLFRDYAYCRIDGGTAHEDRIAAIDEYNKPGSEKFVFLLTTRAGGLGINLTTADIVVLFDSDWNPQADLQAMDRAHRIGQTKQVYVFRFVTENAIEERILERAAQKLRLDQLVIQQGRAQQAAKAAQSKEDLVGMIQHGAEKIITSKDTMSIDDDIDEIIKSGETRTQEIQAKYQSLNLDDLNNFKSDTVYNWEGSNFSERKPIGQLWIEPSKRERKANYSIDNYYRDAMRVGPKPAQPRAPRAPKQININDFQFYPPRLGELQERETAAYQRSIGYRVPLREPGEGETADDVEEERKREQNFIDTAEALTEDEVEEKEQLAQQGFAHWNRREFQTFVRGCERYGRKAYALIAADMPDASKTEKEVREYAKVFWERIDELADHAKLLARIDEGEAKLLKQHHQEAVLRRKVNSYRQPLLQLKLHYGQNKGKSYSEDEDRFLLVKLAEYGLGEGDAYDRIKKDVMQWAGFRFDWFIKSRTPQELGRRCNTLVLLVLKEDEEEKATKGGKKRQLDSASNAGSSRGGTPAAAGAAKKKKK